MKVPPTGTQLAVPVWMLDPIFCGQLRDQSHPGLSIAALIALRELLDTQPILHRPIKLISTGASRGGGGEDAPEDVGHHAAAHAAIRTP